MEQKLIVTTKQNTLEKQVSLEKHRRDVMKGYVQSELVEGVDYGTIESQSKSGKNFKSKPTLFKPGMEKILSLMGIISTLEKDTDTWEMLGSKSGIVAYKCTLWKGKIAISEGRGNATVGENGRDANSTVKIAEKRARMDATLSLGFSEYFTQDLDDTPRFSQPQQKQERVKIPNGDHEVTVLSQRSGETNGMSWKLLETDKGSVFNNTEYDLEDGETYSIRVEKNGIIEVYGQPSSPRAEDLDIQAINL